MGQFHRLSTQICGLSNHTVTLLFARVGLVHDVNFVQTQECSTFFVVKKCLSFMEIECPSPSSQNPAVSLYTCVISIN
jgi:hypothetical protein